MKSIPNHKNYFATKNGGIFYSDGLTHKELKQNVNKDGYFSCSLKVNGIWRKREVHRLICMAFNGDSGSAGTLARHLDDNKFNNSPENLCWGSAMDNQNDARRNWVKRSKLGHWNSSISEDQAFEIKHLLFLGGTCKRIAEAYGLTRQAVSRIKNGHVWCHI